MTLVSAVTVCISGCVLHTDGKDDSAATVDTRGGGTVASTAGSGPADVSGPAPAGGGDTSGDGATTAGGTTAGGTDTTAPAPKAVADCDGLTQTGAWENIMPDGVTNAQAIALDPFVSGTVWMGASSTFPGGLGGVYKSTDCGAHWAHINTGAGGAGLDNGAMWSMAIDFVHQGTMYVVAPSGQSGLWKSTDGGVDWRQLFAADSEFATHVAYNTAASVTMDPTDPLHLVVAPHSKCLPPYANMCNAESTDGGDHWRMMVIPGPDWGEATGPILLNATSWLSTLVGLQLTTDNGATWQDVTPTGIHYVNGGEYTHTPMRKSALGHYYLPTSEANGLITSTDGITWTHIDHTPEGQYDLGFAMGGGRLFISDFSGGGYWVADEATPEVWTALPLPGATYNNQAFGAESMEYDEPHDVLYSANFQGGFFRLVQP